MLTLLLITCRRQSCIVSIKLKLVADKIVIEYESNTKKAELHQAMPDYFVEEDLIPEEQPPKNKSELEIRWLELEHRANEQQRDQECQLKMKELELREKELEMKDKEMHLQLKLKVRATESCNTYNSYWTTTYYPLHHLT